MTKNESDQIKSQRYNSLIIFKFEKHEEAQTNNLIWINCGRMDLPYVMFCTQCLLPVLVEVFLSNQNGVYSVKHLLAIQRLIFGNRD